MGLALDAAQARIDAKVRAAVPVSAWAAEHMRTERGDLLDFERYPHMRAVMDDPASELAMMCGSQTGKTTTALCRAFHFCDTHTVTAIVTMPTDKDVREFSKTRATPAIQASPYLRERMGEVDSMELKTFRHDDGGQSVIFFRGARVETQALSIPADLLYHDEIDRSRPDILSLYIARLAASRYGRRIVTSTPTLPKYGIAACWEDSSRTQWLVKCPACGDEQPLTWPDSLAIDAADPHYICGRGHELTRETIRQGRWVDERTDTQVAWRAYHFSRMLMDLWPASRIVQIEKSADYQDYPELFHNDVLGLPKSSGDLALNEEMLAKVMVGFPPAARAERSFAGAEQSPKPENHRMMIGTVDAEGSTAYIHLEVCGWDRMAELMVLYNIERLVLDALPETSKARELRDAFPGRVYLAYYPNQAVLKRADDSSIVLDRRDGQVDLDRTATLDQSARRVQLQQDFFCAMPARLREQVMTEMTNMVRGTEKDDHGQPRSFWAEVGPDHWRHAHNYATVAGELFRRWSGGLTITSLDLTPANAQRTVKTDDGR
ncbi:MAG TPA: phage terminase large subunit family protein, partial [Armatimonadota bacterium]|nr:phage terminase large subunit family protein [Armatimonadota bacterium]